MQKKIHEINPYRSREERIVFSTWNLDHRLVINITYLLFPPSLKLSNAQIPELERAISLDFDGGAISVV